MIPRLALQMEELELTSDLLQPFEQVRRVPRMVRSPSVDPDGHFSKGRREGSADDVVEKVGTVLGVEIEGGEEGSVEEVFEFEGGSWSVSVGVDGFDLVRSQELVGWKTEG